MQTAGELVILVGEFSAGMQPRQNQFNAGDLVLGMNVHRHAATIVRHRQRAIGIEVHFNA